MLWQFPYIKCSLSAFFKKFTMPTNKNASFRYRILNDCFRNRQRQWTLKALVDKVSQELNEEFGIDKGISIRQVQQDINIMRRPNPAGFDAPIICKGGNYYYSDPTYTIEKKALNELDISSLNEALRILRQFRGLPHFREIGRILIKMEGKVKFNDPEEDLISFEKIDLVKGHEWLQVIYTAVKQQTVLMIEYFPFQAAKSFSVEVHSYYLKEYKGRWYVFAWISEWSRISNLALDRIMSILPRNKQFRQNFDFNPISYFNDIVGVTLPESGRMQIIRIKVAVSSAFYVKSKLIHPTQFEEESAEEYSIFKFNLIPNYEFEAELLRLCEAVEVLSPPDFREKIQKRLSGALTKYNGII
jgi:predicted DNA-binding transcriptional regulator YafY